MRRGRWAAAGAAAVLAVGLTWAASGDPPRIRSSGQRITVVDGPKNDQRISLDTTLVTPARTGRFPAVLLAHGFGGSKDDVRADAERLARDGYAVLTWSARGFGRSGGQITLDSPDYDVKDVRQLVDWLARRPEVRLDAPGDPRVGIAGQSYGGGIALMAAAYDRRIDAIAPQITWYDLADALFPDATGAGPGHGVFKKVWAGTFFTGGASSTACGRFLPSLCTMYQTVAETGLPTPEAIATLRRSSPSSVAGRIHVPTLLVQGQTDSLFPLDQADANARAISGAPVKVVWYQGGHDGGDPETARVRGLVTGWFDRYLKDGAGASAGAGRAAPHGTGSGVPDGFTVTRSGGVDSSTQRVVINAATAPRYPGLSGAQRRAVPLSQDEQVVQNPAGGAPASISTLPGFGALGGLGALGAAGGPPLDMPGQSADFDSEPLTAPVQLTGAARVRVHVRVLPATPGTPGGGSGPAATAGAGRATPATSGDRAAGAGAGGTGAGGTGPAGDARAPSEGAAAAGSGAPGGTNVPAGTNAHGSTVSAAAGGWATLFAKLYDVGPDGRATPARSLVAPLTVNGTADVTLPAMDHRFDTGHRIRVVFAATDMGFASPARPAAYAVSVASPLTVPVDPALRTPPTPLPWWVWGLPAIAVAAAVVLVATGRGRRPRDGGTGDPGVPLEIVGLTKRYRNGHLAVDDLSFRVELGQVCGLLGPNGAGKPVTRL